MSRRGISVSRAALLLAAWCVWTAAHAESADGAKPIHMEADRVRIDDVQQLSTFTGNVVLTQGTRSLKGEQIVVKRNKQGFERGTATGHPAEFREKRDGSDEYVEAYGERIDYDVIANVVNIYGQAQIKRGQNSVSGDHVVYDLRTEVFQATGAPPASSGKGPRVTVEIQPGTGNAASGPRATDSLKIKPATTLSQPKGQP